MSQTLYAHTARRGGDDERLETHLKETSARCAEYLSPMGQGRTGALMGLIHDLGKADPLFQQVLRGERQRVNHALAGAALAMMNFGPDSRLGRALALSVGGHHGGLDTAVLTSAKALYTSGIQKDALDRDVALGDTVSLAGAVKWLKAALPGMLQPVDKLPPSGMDDLYAANLSDMLMTRMLFSGLVDADWSATAEFDDEGYIEAHTGAALDADAALNRLLALREEKRQAAREMDGGARPIDKKRDALFDRCLSAGEGAPGLYTLTAPTGLGKTLSLMAFALSHARKYGKRRVIVLLPWLTLTEQNTAEYRRVFSGDNELLEVHSAASLQPEESGEPEDEFLRARLRGLTERWSAPCVVTTTVSFFEPLFSDKPRSCRHLHQLADSVIILDEAQALQHGLLEATLVCVRELVDKYRCTVLFSTATQPRYEHVRGLESLWQPREIVDEPEKLAEDTRRVIYDWRIGSDAFTRERLTGLMTDQKQALLIVNTRALAQAMYGLIRSKRGEGVYLLSADLCMAHRRDVLDKVRGDLAAGRECLLVATSCVEAGVDISFPVLYRQLAPLESVIQAAGRCNRHGDRPDGRVTIFEMANGDDNKYPDVHYENCAKALKAMKMDDPTLDPGEFDVIDRYDARIFGKVSDREALRKAVEAEDYPGVRKAYHMIDDYGVNLIVPYDMAAFERLREKADSEGLTGGLIAQARAYTINVPLKLVEDVACPIPVRGRDAEAWQGWYILGDPRRYDAAGGCGLLRDIQGGGSGGFMV